MELHPDIAKGFSKGDKVKIEKLWNDLTSQLNASGPPVRDVATWKKTWCDWRRSIKTRLAENKSSLQKTDGGNFQNYYLSPVEEQLAIICDVFHAVEGIPKAKSFGAGTSMKPSDKDCTNNLEISTTQAILVCNTAEASDLPTSPCLSPELTPQNKRKRFNGEIQDIIGEETKNFMFIAEKNSELNETIKCHTTYLKNTCRHIDDIRSIKKREFEENKRHHLEMEKIAMARNQMKLEFLKLEKMKLGYMDEYEEIHEK